MKSTIHHQIRAAWLAVLSVLTLCGCCCKHRHCHTTGTSSEAEPSDLPADCRPTPKLARFDFDTTIKFEHELNLDQGAYRWFRLQGNAFVPLQETAKHKNVTSKELKILSLRPEDLAHYAYLKDVPRPNYKDAFCENRVYSLMGYTNTGGTITVWGTPLTSSGNSSANTCNNQPCPGAYAKKVDFDWGWRPISSTAPCSVQDGSTSTQPSTKVRYWGASTAPLCGCSGTLNIPSPNPARIYTFTLYFPSGVTPLNPHPLIINNMNPEP